MISDETQNVLNGKPEQPQQPQQGGQQSHPLEEAMTQWVRGSYMVSALGPKDVRGAMTAAQESFASMVQNTMGKKRSEALQARKSWEQNSMSGLQANRQRLIDYGLIWANDEMSLDDKMSALRESAGRKGDIQVQQLTASPDQFTTFGQFYDLLSNQQQQAEQSTKLLDDMIKEIEKSLPPAPEDAQTSAGGAPPIDEFVDGWNL